MAVANEFLGLRNTTVLPAQMQLQKLVYISHGWNLAINHQPLVNERPEAWDNGPVFRSMWNHIKDYGYSSKTCLLGSPTGQIYKAALTSDEQKVIQQVWAKYRRFSGYDLSEMTHRPNTPWSKAYFSRGQNASLSNVEIEQHYRELALAGRASG